MYIVMYIYLVDLETNVVHRVLPRGKPSVGYLYAFSAAALLQEIGMCLFLVGAKKETNGPK